MRSAHYYRGQGPDAMRSALDALVEGERLWGVLDLPNTISRSGWDRYRLLVYPPGTNGWERRALTFNRRWPLWGAVLVLVGEMVFGSVLPPIPCLIAGVVVYVAGVITGLRLTVRLRPEVHVLSIACVIVGGEVRTVGDVSSFEESVAALDQLDAGLSSGDLTPAQYEAGWSAVYDEIVPETSSVTGR